MTTLITPILTFKDAANDKTNMLKTNKNKTGIYRWTNKISNKFYIGSAVDISKRLKSYFSNYYLNRQIKTNNSMIYRAILKYGYSNFSFDVLEYCDVKNLLVKEQYYIDLLNPEYNILKTAGSVLGFKHSKSTIEKIRISNIGRKHSTTTKLNLSANSVKAIKVTLTNTKTGEIRQFTSIRSAALYCNKHPSYIAKCLKNKGIYNNELYTVTIST